MASNSVGLRAIIALVLCLWACRELPAVQITMNLVPSQSYLTLNGEFGGTPIVPQDESLVPTPGTTDLDPSNPSNRTPLSGTITVDVDNVMSPSTIQILAASMDAGVTGNWVPEPQPLDDTPIGDDPPTIAAPADIAIKVEVFLNEDCCNIHYATLRDLTYNLATVDLQTEMPVSEPVNPQGEFSSLSQVLTYSSGFLDFWLGFPASERGRDDVTGDSAPNQHEINDDTLTPFPDAPASTFIVAGNTATLTIPVKIDVIDSFTQRIGGQFVATFEISAGLDGDYNGDGAVDAADYVAWRKTPLAFGGDPGYDTWLQNFGTGGTGGNGAVPEPGTLMLLIAGLVGVICRRSNRVQR